MRRIDDPEPVYTNRHVLGSEENNIILKWENIKLCVIGSTPSSNKKSERGKEKEREGKSKSFPT